MKKILYLPIETIARELDARMLIAHQAVSRGYFVVTGQKENVFKAAGIIGEGIFFYKSHGVKNYPGNKTTKFRYITLDEEGLVFVDNNEYLRNSKPYELDHLDIVFTWGSYQRDLLIRENPVLEKKVIPIGNSRFDLLRPEFRQLYSSEGEKIRKKWGDYIIINTRFAPGNFSRLYECSYVESRRHQYITFIGREPSQVEADFLEREAKYYHQLFNQYVAMLKVISKKLPDVNFILRPHPSEDLLNWKEALGDLKNVHVIFEGSAIDWILGAIAVIHTGCTTGIEAWALKKPVIAYNPNETAGVEPPLPNKFGIRIKDIDSLYTVLKGIMKGKSSQNYDEQTKIAKLFIENITGDYSVTRFLNAIEGFSTSGSVNDPGFKRLKDLESTKGAVKVKILKFLSRYQHIIKKYSGSKISGFIYDRFKKYPGLFAQFKKFPGLKAGDIRKRLAEYDRILNNDKESNYSVKKIATDTFAINKSQKLK